MQFLCTEKIDFLKDNIEAITESREEINGITIEKCYHQITINSSNSGNELYMCDDKTSGAWFFPSLDEIVYPCKAIDNGTPAFLSKKGYCWRPADEDL